MGKSIALLVNTQPGSSILMKNIVYNSNHLKIEYAPEIYICMILTANVSNLKQKMYLSFFKA